ncbi:MAG: acyltransferase family protein [Candidatus Dadabacteria bacterium]|nr:MAG: acyltransferase family protein [Candidatus Dadabacteria bacterium]
MARGVQSTRRSAREAAAAISRMRKRKRLAVDPAVREQLERLTAPRREEALLEGADRDYGLDLEFRRRVEPLFRFLFESYWRVEVIGIEHVPPSGPAILVGNHSGGLPFDATMVAYALSSERGPGRIARPLYDRFVERFGPVREFFRKLGGVPARYAVADELLSRGELPVIFPEGVGGVAKLYDDRYHVGRFSTSAPRLSMRHRAPIVPFAVVGAEEIYPLIGRSAQIGRALGAPYLPITPFFPFLGPLGLIPLPTKWTIVFGNRIHLYRERRFQGAASTDFEAMADRLRRTVQILLRRQLRRRKSIFLG